jgi:splicing factor 3A subunit 1
LVLAAFAMIDWHDFVVVDTIEFTDADELLTFPPPISIMDLQNMTIAQKRAAASFETVAPAQEEEDGDMDVCSFVFSTFLL